MSLCLLDDTSSTEGCGFKESVPIMQLFVACLLWFTWIFPWTPYPHHPPKPRPQPPFSPLTPCFVNNFLDSCPSYSSCVFNCLPVFPFFFKVLLRLGFPLKLGALRLCCHCLCLRLFLECRKGTYRIRDVSILYMCHRAMGSQLSR